MAVRIREEEGFGHEQYDYKKYLREEKVKQNWDGLKDKTFGVLVGKDTVEMTGREIVSKINDVITKQNEVAITWLKGNKEKVDYYLDMDDGTHQGLVRLKNEFLNDLREASNKHEPLDIELGVDGLNRIAKRILISQVPEVNRAEAQESLRKRLEIEETETGEFKPEMYFPHVNFNRGQARDRLLESIERTLDDKTLEKKDRDLAVQRLIHHYKQMTGDWVTKDEMGG